MAYAIIKTGGKQYKVSEGDIIHVEKLDGEPDGTLTFDEVLLHVDGGNVSEGRPTLDGAKVTGKVVEQYKASKVVAYKFRRRKGYHRTVGHRRRMTAVKIDKISA